MKWIIATLIIIFAGGLGYLYYQDPGHLEVTWNSYHFTTSAIVGLGAFSFLFFSLLVLVSLISWIFSLPRKWSSYFKRSREVKADEELIAYLSSYEAERFDEALEHRANIASVLAKNPFYLWLSGRTYEKKGEFLESGYYYFELMNNPSTAFLGLKGAIRSALHHLDEVGAYSLLDRAEKSDPDSIWVLKHILAFARKRKDYKRAESTIIRLEKLEIFSSDESKRQIGHLYYERALDPATVEEDKEGLLRQAHMADLSHLETTKALAEVYVEKGNKKYALSAIESTMSLSPDISLGEYYLNIYSPKNDVEAYDVASRLVQHSLSNANSMIFLVTVALQAKLWGEARAHLNKLIKLAPSPQVYQLLARLELEEKQDIPSALKWLMIKPA